jgi:hypothetical protein
LTSTENPATSVKKSETILRISKMAPCQGLTRERIENYVPFLFSSVGKKVMIRAVVEEAATLASLALFLGMIAIWAQVIAALLTTPTL